MLNRILKNWSKVSDSNIGKTWSFLLECLDLHHQRFNSWFGQASLWVLEYVQHLLQRNHRLHYSVRTFPTQSLEIRQLDRGRLFCRAYQPGWNLYVQFSLVSGLRDCGCLKNTCVKGNFIVLFKLPLTFCRHVCISGNTLCRAPDFQVPWTFTVRYLTTLLSIEVISLIFWLVATAALSMFLCHEQFHIIKYKEWYSSYRLRKNTRQPNATYEHIVNWGNHIFTL